MSFFLVEFLGKHQFTWVQEADIIGNFDPDDDATDEEAEEMFPLMYCSIYPWTDKKSKAESSRHAKETGDGSKEGQGGKKQEGQNTGIQSEEETGH